MISKKLSKKEIITRTKEIITRFRYARRLMAGRFKGKDKRFRLRLEFLWSTSAEQLAIIAAGALLFHVKRQDAALALALRANSREIDDALNILKEAALKGWYSEHPKDMQLREMDIREGALTFMNLLAGVKRDRTSGLMETAVEIAFKQAAYVDNDFVRAHALKDTIPGLAKIDPSLATTSLSNRVLLLATTNTGLESKIRSAALECAARLVKINPTLASDILGAVKEPLLQHKNSNIRICAEWCVEEATKAGKRNRFISAAP